MTVMTFFLLFIGLTILVTGAEVLIRGSSALANNLKVSPLVIGLTVVAFGTSSPELAVSLDSIYGGQADVALGNIVGSNICNILLILGMTALIRPLSVNSQVVRWDVPVMLASAVGLWLFALDGRIGFVDGLVLLTGLAGYLWSTVRLGKTNWPAPEAMTTPPAGEASLGGKTKMTLAAVMLNLGLIIVGLGLLVFGADTFVEASRQIARAAGLSELTIGLTIVAVGTSLPEIAASAVSAMRGHVDMAVGNVVGSCIFNSLAIMGLTATLSGTGVPVNADALHIDIPIMTAVTAACLPIFVAGFTVTRYNGATFLFYYVAYTAYLLLQATQAPLLALLKGTVLGVILPITVFLLMMSLFHSLVRAESEAAK